MYGNNDTEVDPVYKANSTTPAKPGAHYGASYWSDSEGHFWLFGGSAHVTGGRDSSILYILLFSLEETH